MTDHTHHYEHFDHEYPGAYYCECGEKETSMTDQTNQEKMGERTNEEIADKLGRRIWNEALIYARNNEPFDDEEGSIIVGPIPISLQDGKQSIEQALDAKDAHTASLEQRIANLENKLNSHKIACDSFNHVELIQLKMDKKQLEQRIKELEAKLSKAREEIEKLKEWRNEPKPGEECWYCGSAIQDYAANPSLWPLYFPHKEEPGKVKAHHVRCVMKELNALADLRAQLEATQQRNKTLEAVLQDVGNVLGGPTTGYASESRQLAEKDKMVNEAFELIKQALSNYE